LGTQTGLVNGLRQKTRLTQVSSLSTMEHVMFLLWMFGLFVNLGCAGHSLGKLIRSEDVDTASRQLGMNVAGAILCGIGTVCTWPR